MIGTTGSSGLAATKKMIGPIICRVVEGWSSSELGFLSGSVLPNSGVSWTIVFWISLVRLSLVCFGVEEEKGAEGRSLQQ
ncbi:hypothetical protein L6452_01916 [Arctium lappa]|uniref:Uncharacterized protein n=1 Tax=Arctium lappa TaxID=4217 RepID=A0ACB9FJG6_ARCLA|nr:hypothetical protein L6452_01916 [Arctium lappa]